jgi:phosphoserine phosphatase RsbU/P
LRENQEQFRVAREIQQRLFPEAAPSLPGFDIAGATYPAEATGGDYFDYLQMLNWGWGFVVADVAGHGIGPALLMAETRAYLRLLGGRREDPGEILTLANTILAEDVGSERFVTLFLARLTPASRILTYASAGHHAAYVLDAEGRLRLTLPRTAIPLGLRSDTRYASSAPIQLEPGDLLLIVTDGTVESMSPTNEIFGEERLLDVARRNRHRPAREIVESLYHAVRDFAQHTAQIDDVTAIVIRVK